MALKILMRKVILIFQIRGQLHPGKRAKGYLKVKLIMVAQMSMAVQRESRLLSQKI